MDKKKHRRIQQFVEALWDIDDVESLERIIAEDELPELSADDT